MIHDFPLNSRIASSMATIFSTGTFAWMLWTVLKTKPPSLEKISQFRNTWSRTSPGLPKGSTFCVSTPPPQKTKSRPYFCFNFLGSIPAAFICTGLIMSNPARIKLSIKDSTAPQECLNVFHSVFL
jgi:hypothetical protein